MEEEEDYLDESLFLLQRRKEVIPESKAPLPNTEFAENSTPKKYNSTEELCKDHLEFISRVLNSSKQNFFVKAEGRVYVLAKYVVEVIRTSLKNETPFESILSSLNTYLSVRYGSKIFLEEPARLFFRGEDGNSYTGDFIFVRVVALKDVVDLSSCVPAEIVSEEVAGDGVVKL